MSRRAVIAGMIVCSSLVACTFVLGLRDDYYVADASADAAFDAPAVTPWVLALRNGVANVKIEDLAIDPTTGDVGIAGYFTGTVDLGDAGKLEGSPTLGTAFFARLDMQGHVLWKATAIGGTAELHGNAIAFGPNGQMAVTASGYTSSATDVFGKTVITSSCPYTSFLSRVAPDGSPLRPTKAFCNGSFAHLAYDGKGNLAATGIVLEASNDLAPSGAALPAFGLKDVLVAVLTPDDSRAWARSFGTADYDEGIAVTFGADGAVYAVGLTNSTQADGGVQSIAFDDAGTAGGNGYDDAFLIRLDGADGHVTKVVSIGGVSVDDITGVFDAKDHVVVSGSMIGVGTVGSQSAPGPAGNSNFYFASVDYAGNASGVRVDSNTVATFAGPAVSGATGAVVLPLLVTCDTSPTALTLGSAALVSLPADDGGVQIGVVSSWPANASTPSNVLTLPPLVAQIRNATLRVAVHAPTSNLVIAGAFDRTAQLGSTVIVPEQDAGGTPTGAFVFGYGKWP